MGLPEDPKVSARHFEERNWDRARQKFLDKHNSSNHPAKIEEFLADRITITDAKAACQASQQKAKEEYRPTLGSIMAKIEIAMKVGDLAIKSAPESIGLAWAGIRLCLQSVEDDYATFSTFATACTDIIGILISCSVYGEMYSVPKGPDSFRELNEKVTEFIPTIYSDILEFSYQMKKHMGSHKACPYIHELSLSSIKPANLHSAMG
jgi:hypothetical protein